MTLRLMKLTSTKWQSIGSQKLYHLKIRVEQYWSRSSKIETIKPFTELLQEALAEPEHASNTASTQGCHLRAETEAKAKSHVHHGARNCAIDQPLLYTSGTYTLPEGERPTDNYVCSTCFGSVAAQLQDTGLNPPSMYVSIRRSNNSDRHTFPVTYMPCETLQRCYHSHQIH